MKNEENMFYEDEQFFLNGFRGITARDPFAWQKRLFAQFMGAKIPKRVALPTGAGKTSLMVIWLLAWVRMLHKGMESGIPRRLIWIVDRRVVVDQATAEALNIREKILYLENNGDSGARNVLKIVKNQLQKFCMNHLNEEVPLAISTLRGELADNREWKKDPSKAAIIVGTVDMIGSRLLFSGYGDGSYFRPYHAGLMGIDAMIALDEAHLSPSLVKTLRQVENHASATAKSLIPMKMIEITATPRGQAAGTFSLSADDPDMKDPESELAKRMMARKRLYVHACETTPEEKSKAQHDALVTQIVSTAIDYAGSGQRIAIYVRSPQLAQRIYKGLVQSKNIRQNQVGLLTGTIRGYERDHLENGPLFKAFYEHDGPAKKSAGNPSYYLVMTSAGEVGVNLNADHMICDLVSLESLIQRLGRVLRFAAGDRIARIDLLHTLGKPTERHRYKKKILEKISETPEWKTLELLEARSKERLNQNIWNNGSLNSTDQWVDVSPWSFVANPFPESTYSKTPWSPLLDRSHLDQWAMTSIPDRGLSQRRPVEPWLHGVRESLPETYMAWREDVELISEASPGSKQLKNYFSAFRVLAHETVKCNTGDLISFLGISKNPPKGKNAKEKSVETPLEIPVIILHKDGAAQVLSLHQIEERLQEEKNNAFLSYATLLLPPSFGKLKDGVIDLKSTKSKVKDVSCEMAGRSRKRVLVDFDGSIWRWRDDLSDKGWFPVEGAPENNGIDEILKGFSKRFEARVLLKIQISAPSEMMENLEDDAAKDASKGTWLVYFTKDEKRKTVAFEQRLDDHLKQTEAVAVLLSEHLLCSKDLKDAIQIAARFHDLGKNRTAWQQAIKNNGSCPLAKSDTTGFNAKLTGGYRHEFGSLMELSDLATVSDGELVKHLIASHHRSGRPGFDQRAFDRMYPLAQNKKTGREVMEGFFALQKKYGWWGLAYLEAILKAADGLASSGYLDGSIDHEA